MATDQNVLNEIFLQAIAINVDTIIIEKNGNRLIYTREQGKEPLKLTPMRKK